ncbi:MAG TPA: hypothetical protein VN285_10960 [Candidatus Deferrimicrobium sp.]|nr:hypothetical protein [Candidatus Deferrimicrobium sp.]
MSNAPPWILKGRYPKQHQSGFGEQTPCVSCNNNTGSWYAPAFIDFTLEGFISSIGIGAIGQSLKIEFRDIKPLNVIKQILSMIMSANSHTFAARHSSLRKFLLCKDASGLDPMEYRISLYLNRGSIGKFLGITGMMNFFTGERHFVSEVAAPPFSYFLEINPTGKCRYFDITFFANAYSYDFESDLSLPVPILESNSPFPTDHRSQAEIVDCLGVAATMATE